MKTTVKSLLEMAFVGLVAKGASPEEGRLIVKTRYYGWKVPAWSHGSGP